MANDFTISNFKGSLPRLSPHLIDQGKAAKAVDCNLHSGRLSSWREPKKLRDVPEGTKTVHRFGCCWADFDSCVDIAHGPVTCTRAFVTGYREYPITIQFDADCNMIEHRLGVPCPDRAPSASTVSDLDDTDEKDLEGRSYAYQYVNRYDERGALSPGSKAENVRDGQPVVVSGWATPDASWGIDRIRIYRTVTAHTDSMSPNELMIASWMLVAEIPVTDTSFTDKAHNEDLLSALEEDLVPPPPADLQGIIWVDKMNTLAGFVGRRVYFNNNNEYHHWPHYFDLDDTITAMVESNGVLYVMTRGRPYCISAEGSCAAAECREIVRLPGEYPMVGFGNKHTTRLGSGAVYPSHDGLVLLNGNSAPTLYTWQLYSPEIWQELEPHTAVLEEVSGKLFAFFANGAFITSSMGDSKQGWSNDFHTELSDRDVVDVFKLDTGELCLLKPDGVYLWNRGDELRPHLWVSGEVAFPTPRAMGAVNARFANGPEHLKIVSDERTVLDRDILSKRVMRLPMWAHGSYWHFELSGTAEVAVLSIAPSMHDLGQ